MGYNRIQQLGDVVSTENQKSLSELTDVQGGAICAAQIDTDNCV